MDDACSRAQAPKIAAMVNNLPDPDWYLDNVVVPSGPDRHPVGPIRRHLAAWDTVAQRLATNADPGLAAAESRALEQGLVLTRAQARDAGIPDAQVRSLLRRGLWTRARFGVLAPFPASGIDLDVIRMTAAALVRPGAVISHAGAAVVHGLPLLHHVARPTMTMALQRLACVQDDVRVYAAAMPKQDIENWFGASIATVDRTILDVARNHGAAAGLVCADAALHEGVTTSSALGRALEVQFGWPGVRRARRVLALADARSESPLESLTRLCLVSRGVPPPELQVWVDTDRGRYRVDFFWPELKVIVEADGMRKYQQGWQSLVDEKRRQEALERAGYTVIRVLWEDVTKYPDRTAARVLAALARAARTLA